MGIVTCERCGIKFNNETIEKCPVCIFHKENEEWHNKFDSEISELKKCSSLSRKGKNHKQCGFKIKYDKRFENPFQKI